MSEQQDHLKNLLNQRQSILNEIAELNQQIIAKRELALRASGAIEYLQQIGIEVPVEEAPVSEEPPRPEEEIADAVAEPTSEG